MTCLWIDIPWTLGFKLFSVGHFGCLASIWIVIATWWHGMYPMAPMSLYTCMYIKFVNSCEYPTYQKVSAANFDRSGHAQPLFGNSVILIWLLLVPACIPILYHIPSPLQGWVSPTACPSRVVKTSPMAVLAALPSTCWKDQYNWTSKVCQWYYWWFRHPARKPPEITGCFRFP